MVLSIPKYNRVRLVQSFNCTSLATSECDASCMLVRRKCFRELIAATSMDILEFLVVKLYSTGDARMQLEIRQISKRLRAIRDKGQKNILDRCIERRVFILMICR